MIIRGGSEVRRPRTSVARPLAAAAVLGAVIVGVSIHHNNTDAAKLGRFCRSVASPQQRGADVPVTNGRPTVVVLGDSYASGFELAQPREAWPTQLGRLEHWQVFVDGIAGTGTVNGALCDQPYARRVQQVLSHHPQRVIVEVGLNDTQATAPAIRSAATGVLASLSPVPEVDVVGPPPVPGKALADVQRVDAALRSATLGKRRTYVSALGWRLTYLPDKIHLTPAGHQQFARLVAAGIRG